MRLLQRCPDKQKRFSLFLHATICHNSSALPLTASIFLTLLLFLTGEAFSYVSTQSNSAAPLTDDCSLDTLSTHDTSAALARQIVRTKNGQSTRTVWGLGVLYEVKPDGSVIYHHHDLVGSTIALSDGTGNITERIHYSPYRQIQSRLSLNSTPHDTPYLFTGFYGNETDSTGLIHMRARFYSPLLHRFLNSDPAREGNNWYAYAAGNPLGFVDPSGLGIESALDTIQSTLSFLGMLPVVGAAFDLVNSGISVARGNFVDAGFHFLSAAPGIGDLAAGAKIVAGGAAIYGGYRAYSAVSRSSISPKITEYMGSGSQHFASDLSNVTGKAATSRNRAIAASIATDLPNLKLTHIPQYNPWISHGVAQRGAGTQIGAKSFESRSALRNTIVHEELHHRWWSRGILDHHPAGSAKEAKFYNTIYRYERMRRWVK